VIALEGDGSILMALGCLATIGMTKPRNLTIIIMDNGLYQITGKQATATAATADIVAIARGAGIADSHWVRDEAHFDALTSRRFDEGGPVLLATRSTMLPELGKPCAIHRSFATASCAGWAPAAPARSTADL
jgi:thiamine pyrophosphate-dependent acetolactate synthase large subunit-like protein